MWLPQFRWRLCFLTILALSLTACMQTSRPSGVVVVSPIITPVPTTKVLVAVPPGYVRCRVVEGSWYYRTWIPQHRICTYANRPGRLVWVDGYWACTQFSNYSGRCSGWSWRSAHWNDSVMVVY
ncbi:MAG TPA: hypothetical protein VLI69_08625 [Gammaproteobacteria bacterium]|nr:hypothetical protein [Gammaproteobacteria bacterium]